MDLELTDYFWKPMKSKEGRKSFVHFANCLNNKHLLQIERGLRRMDLPVLIIRGDADPHLSLEISRRLHSEIPVEINAHIFELNGKRVVMSVAPDMSTRNKTETALLTVL
jgi:pimeloyl-ACP methyl ester carboxylesterase